VKKMMTTKMSRTTNMTMMTSRDDGMIKDDNY
jgi:hypothetical protein